MKNIFYIAFIFSLLSCNNQTTCTDLHEGKFGYTHPEHSHIKIIRSGDSQIEINTESKIEAHTKIEWISDCEYKLTYEAFKNAPEEFNEMIGETIHAKIIKISGNKYSCRIEEEDGGELMEFKILKEK